MSRLAIYLLGSFQVTLDGMPVRAFRADKTRALLAYLVVEAQHPHRRERLAGLLWPELPDEAAHWNLRQALFRLRRAIADSASGPPHLLVTAKELQTNPESDIFLDVGEFEGMINTYQAHHGDGSLPCNACATALRAATDLYRGEFMAGFDLPDSPAFEHWRLVRQEYYHWRALEVLTRLLDYYESVQDYEQVCWRTLQKLELDPWSEHSYQRRMKALALSGQRSLALQQYRVCQDVLERELGIMPAAETTRLYEQIRDQTLEGMKGEGGESTKRKRAFLLTQAEKLIDEYLAGEPV